jgi:hypothetical protein
LDVEVKEFFALAIDDADAPLAGVEVDSAVEPSGGLAAFHGRALVVGFGA